MTKTCGIHRTVIALDRALLERIFKALASLNCPIGAPWGINTPQISHSESLRSSFEDRFFEVRKSLGGCGSQVFALWSVQHCDLCDGWIYRIR